MRSFPRRDLRTVSYGLLGPKAVSVAYREGRRLRTERVTRGLGAYLVVQRSAPGKHVEPPGAGGGVSGSGEIIAKKPLTAIVYRVAGRLCDRALGHMHENGCSSPHALPPQQAPRKRDLHERLRTRLLVSKGEVTGVRVSFRAPFAVTSARADYSIGIADCRDVGEGPAGLHKGFSESTLEHDVQRGQVVSLTLSDPFQHPCGRRSIVIEAFYARGNRPAPQDELDSTLIGRATLRLPQAATVRPSSANSSSK